MPVSYGPHSAYAVTMHTSPSLSLEGTEIQDTGICLGYRESNLGDWMVMLRAGRCPRSTSEVICMYLPWG